MRVMLTFRRLSSLLPSLAAALFLCSSAPAQPSIPAPAADHHTHIWSIKISELGIGPWLPPITLPKELDDLLRTKERQSKLRSVDALKDIYTKDLLAMEAGDSTWLKGEAALRYIAESTIINKLIPTSYEVKGDMGYVSGTEVVESNGVQNHVSNFLYLLRREEGKWKISVETFTMQGPKVAQEAGVDALVRELDAAGVKKAAVLSVAYLMSSGFRAPFPDEYERVKAENDWAAEQIGKHPGKLVGLLSFNPLRDYAVQEMDRCAKNPLYKGIKLHLGNSKVDLLKQDHVDKLKAIFKAANDRRIPILIHLWTVEANYGAQHSKVFLEEILPAAPDIPVQIAHMAASGPGYHSDDAMEVFANAAEAKNPRMKNVYVDVASMVIATTPKNTLDLVAKRLRQVGMDKVLFASDRAPGGGNETPGAAWSSFLRLPLTDAEFRTVAANVAPYLK